MFTKLVPCLDRRLTQCPQDTIQRTLKCEMFNIIVVHLMATLRNIIQIQFSTLKLRNHIFLLSRVLLLNFTDSSGRPCGCTVTIYDIKLPCTMNSRTLRPLRLYGRRGIHPRRFNDKCARCGYTRACKYPPRNVADVVGISQLNRCGRDDTIWNAYCD